MTREEQIESMYEACQCLTRAIEWLERGDNPDSILDEVDGRVQEVREALEAEQ